MLSKAPTIRQTRDMARVRVFPDRVVIELTQAEKTLSFRRRDIVLDREAITSAIITHDPWVWLRGVRSPGTHLPGRLAMGTWRNLAGKDFALVRKGANAVVIDLESVDGDSDHERGWVTEFDSFTRVVLSTAHAAELIQGLRLGVAPGTGEDGDAPVYAGEAGL